MDLVWAQIKKDFILNRYAILGWLLIAFVGLWSDWSFLSLPPEDSMSKVFRIAIEIGMHIGGLLLAVSISLTDATANSNAFCLTRPIRIKKVVVAKLLLILSINLIPELIWSIAFASAYGVNGGLVFLEGSLARLYVLAAVGIASISRSFMHCLFVCAGMVAGTAVAMLVLSYLDRLWAPDLAWFRMSEFWKNAMVREVDFILIGIWGTLVAFLPRALRTQSVRLGVASVVVLMVIVFTWKRLPNLLVNPIQLQGDPIAFEVSSDVSSEEEAYIKYPHSEASVLTRLLKTEIENVQLEPGNEAWPLLLNGRLSFGNEVLDPSYTGTIYRRLATRSFISSTFEDRYRDFRFLNKGPVGYQLDSSFTIFDIPERSIERYSGMSGTYQGAVGLLVLSYDTLAVATIREGDTFSSDYCYGTIERLDIKPNVVSVSASLAVTYSRLDRNSPWWRQKANGNGQQRYILLSNPVRKEALYPNGWSNEFNSTGVRNAFISHYELTFPRSEAVSDEWLEDAELLIVVKNIARFQEKEFVIEDVRL